MRFKGVVVVFALAAVSLIVAGGSRAQEEVQRIDAGDKEFGIILGEPSGFSGKIWTTWNAAVDFGLAWSFSDGGHFHIHADYLFHNFDFFDVEEGSLPIYVGIGGRLRLEEDDPRAGIRIPVGVEYIFEGHRVSLFLEIAPIVDIAPDTEANVNGGVGVRFIF